MSTTCASVGGQTKGPATSILHWQINKFTILLVKPRELDRHGHRVQALPDQEVDMDTCDDTGGSYVEVGFRNHVGSGAKA